MNIYRLIFILYHIIPQGEGAGRKKHAHHLPASLRATATSFAAAEHISAASAQKEIHGRIHRVDLPCRIREAADSASRSERRVVKDVAARRAAERDADDAAARVDRAYNRRRSLQTTLDRHVGVLLVRIYRRAESRRIERRRARTRNIAIARTLTSTRSFTVAMSVARTRA